MTIQKCYEQIGSDYEEVLGRFGKEEFVQRFALKFLKDNNFYELRDALEKKEIEAAFRAAHTLKGICLNLGFKRLYEVSSELTEVLRTNTLEGTEALFKKVETEYITTIEALKNVE